MVARTAAFQAGIRRAGKSVSGFSKQVGTLGRLLPGLATFAAPVGLIAGLRSLGNRTEELNKAMNRSLAIMGDVSRAMREDMRQAAIEVQRTTVFSATQAAEAFFFLASAGLDAKQSLEALPVVAQFAQAGMFDLALATDLLTDAQSALGLSFENPVRNMREMIRVGDVLVKANTLANASVQQFSEALTTKAGAALRVLSKDIEEGVAALAVFADQGIKGAAAGTALQIVLRDLTTKAILNREAFKQMNVSVFDSEGNMRNLGLIIRDLETALSGMNAEQTKATLLALGFTDKSVAYIQSLIGMSEKMMDFETSLRDAGGTMKDVSSTQMTELEKATANLNAVLQEMADQVGAAGGFRAAVKNIIADLLEWGEAGKSLAAALESAKAAWNLLVLTVAIGIETLMKAVNLIVKAIDTLGRLFGTPLPAKDIIFVETLLRSATALVEEFADRVDESFDKLADLQGAFEPTRQGQEPDGGLEAKVSVIDAGTLGRDAASVVEHTDAIRQSLEAIEREGVKAQIEWED